MRHDPTRYRGVAACRHEEPGDPTGHVAFNFLDRDRVRALGAPGLLQIHQNVERLADDGGVPPRSAQLMRAAEELHA